MGGNLHELQIFALQQRAVIFRADAVGKPRIRRRFGKTNSQYTLQIIKFAAAAKLVYRSVFAALVLERGNVLRGGIALRLRNPLLFADHPHRFLFFDPVIHRVASR